MKRLNQDTLSSLPSTIAQPQYSRQELKAGIVHLGIGAFHRAHQAYYTEAVLNQFGGDWKIIGASLRSDTVRDQLEPQDGLYTLVEQSGQGNKLCVIGAVEQVLVAPEDPAALVSAMAAAEIKIVSLTVTEKGYCHDPASGNLKLDHADIQHDLANIEAPRTAIGFIVAGLAQRRAQGLPGYTVLSCDNVPNNGQLLQRVVLQFADQLEPALGQWVRANSRFPSTMIDRIVPATTEADQAELEQHTGLRDQGMVVTEPFTQWVVEDDFLSGRPQWDQVGVLMVDDVSVFEDIKLRLLNGSHSLLAYCGYLAGFDYIYQVMQEPLLADLAKRFMDEEVSSTLTVPAGYDLDHYKQQLLDRFSNSALKHRTWQIAMDGSQKIPQRFLNTLRDRLQAGQSFQLLSLAIAAWIRYVSAVDEKGNAIDVSDPMAQQLAAICQQHQGDPAATVNAVVSLSEVFGEDLIRQQQFVDTTSQHLQSMFDQGVLSTLKALR